MRRAFGVLAVVSLVVAVALPAGAAADRSKSEFDSSLFEFIQGCDEVIWVTGTERIRSDTLTPSSGIERIIYSVEWLDTVAVGLSSGDPYEITSQHEGFVAVGWPPLAPPTSNVLTSQSRISLQSVDGEVERHTLLGHRVLLYDEATGWTTFHAIFTKANSRCG